MYFRKRGSRTPFNILDGSLLDVNKFHGLNIAIKCSIFCVNFLFGWSRNLKMLNRTLLEVDSGMPTAKMELFVTKVYSWNCYITE